MIILTLCRWKLLDSKIVIDNPSILFLGIVMLLLRVCFGVVSIKNILSLRCLFECLELRNVMHYFYLGYY